MMNTNFVRDLSAGDEVGIQEWANHYSRATVVRVTPSGQIVVAQKYGDATASERRFDKSGCEYGAGERWSRPNLVPLEEVAAFEIASARRRHNREVVDAVTDRLRAVARYDALSLEDKTELLALIETLQTSDENG